MVEHRQLAILLSTFNGETFLSEQLDSILQQSFTDFIIVARDDGSVDRTRGILTQYAAEHAGRFFILPDKGSNLGAKASFAALMQYVLEHKSELGLARAYMMFADQDDIWAANKIEIEFKSLLLLETGDGYRMPALVHSDLEVVDFEGKRIAASYIAYQGLQRQRDSLVNQVQSNLVTGCTAVINEELALKVLPIPDQAIMHDWWIAIAAVAYGRRLFIDQCLVRYRQHGRNTIGAKPFVAAAPAV
ncbi:MAG: glycosyltransferase family 2 protein, partial [Pseudomonadota bacterium]|nr:glycosyltransferase family 2 protein [Pseudomonadota bacterium]